MAEKTPAKGQQKKKTSTGPAKPKAVEEVPRERLTPGRRKKIFAVAFLALALFTFLCIFVPGSVGPVGRGVKTALAWALGIGRFAVPFLFLAAAALVFLERPDVRLGMVAAGAALMCASLLAMFSISTPTGVMFTSENLSGGGGLIGASIAWPLCRLIGQVGAYIFTIAAFIAGLVLAFEEQLVAAWKRLREGEARRAPVLQAVDEGGGEAEAQPRKKTAAKPGSAKVYPSRPTPAVAVTEENGGQLAMPVSRPRAGKVKLPPSTLLNRGGAKAFSKQTNEERKHAIEHTLSSMDVDARVVKVSRGPTVSLFEVEVGTGEKVKRVTELEQDIAYALGSPDIRIYSPIPGRQAIGIEVPNHVRDTVLLGDIIEALGPPQPHNLLTVAVGKDMSGEPVVLDLAQLPHLLLAGSTGAGKSCCINCLVCCLLMRCRPDQLNFIMIDPKFVEFTWYDGLPHLLCDVINEPEPAAKALLWAVREMDRRYQVLQKQRVVHIDEYNAIADKDPEVEPMPKIVIVIDELGDLMIVARREVESSISRLTAKARAVGIHLIIATQRPSVDVITGVIKNNITARIAFQVASHADSRTILGGKGAEKLLGKGDMLLDPGNIPQPERVQGALIQQKEIEFLTGYIREQKSPQPSSIDLEEVGSTVKEELSDWDPLLEEAAEFVVMAGEASASMLQTHLRVGYARARRIVVELSQLGIVGPHEGSKSRKVLLTPEELDDWKARRAG
ncbi:MAG: DNA translocase FtsK [Actinobacteria bacterium]|nr:DNA translocase FtsK [Actinomycetota bacterium]MBU1944673.1 DNA translocase FtsK [Actinomycetota bacterium]MBU2689221.1 DNA translocase FtsK [Actinomycetota bacterium]